MAAKVARSLAAVSRATAVLRLSASEDLVCKNIMCAKLGEACVCRLVRVLQRAPDLKELYLDNNNLESLPELSDLIPRLEVLDLRGNRLKEVPATLEALDALRVVRLEGNPCATEEPRDQEKP
uniref:Leucine-rich repeat-containing protein 51 n=1 Tax=Pinguiococcus pyrenoidosus TaxID=172671 RepID=A0A7R9U6R4_9STRA|mmetsp:Transcript_17169/g.65535  ORF Transcript_17169/g.65535 Transcript_17169/m.65535 type:complete len:123 (+) Transcript_17169:53-421(+)